MGEPGTKEVLSLDELEAVSGLRTGRKHILAILANTVGPGNFHFTIPATRSDFLEAVPEAMRGEMHLIGSEDEESDETE